MPITWERLFYVDNGKHTFYPIRPERKGELDAIKEAHPEIDPYELGYILDHFVKKESGGYFPTDSVVVKVNKENVIKSGMWLPLGPDSIPDQMVISLAPAYEKQGGLYRSDVMIYEMLAHSDWQRPLYMTATLGPDNFAGLENFCVLEGLAYRVTPFNFGRLGLIDSKKMYENMMTRFKYGNVNKAGIYLDETVMRMCRTHRRMFSSLADELIRKGQKAEALKVLQKAKEVLPPETVPYVEDDATLASLWKDAGNKKEADIVAKAVLRNNIQYLTYLNSLGTARLNTYARTSYFLVASIIECGHVILDNKDKESVQLRKEIEKITTTEAFSLGAQVYQRSAR